MFYYFVSESLQTSQMEGGTTCRVVKGVVAYYDELKVPSSNLDKSRGATMTSKASIYILESSKNVLLKLNKSRWQKYMLITDIVTKGSLILMYYSTDLS